MAKKIFNLRVTSKKLNGKYVPWEEDSYTHFLTDGVHNFTHWSKSIELIPGIHDIVIQRVLKKGKGVPIGRMVNILV